MRYYCPNQEKQGENAAQGGVWTNVNPVVLAEPKIPVKSDSEYTKRLKGGYGFFGPASLIYACFYAFCMYKNASGVTFPFFMAGSLLYLYLCLSKLEISLKKGSIFYMASMLLLAVATFCTDDKRIINLNKTGIFLLMISLLLNQIYNTGKWQLGKYLKSIFTVTFAGVGELVRPFTDARGYHQAKGRTKKNKGLYVVAGVGAAIPLFFIIALLLYSADAVFRKVIDIILEYLNIQNVFLILLMIFLMFMASYCLLSYLCKQSIAEEVPDRRKGEPVFAITVNVILTAMYLLFCGIQFFYLFLGNMQLPENYTYAGYAREGFFQLLAVSVLNLIIVLISLNYFRESKILKIILTIMSFCTFIMIASSALRMIIYIKYYYLTFLRIFVLWSLAVLFLLFVGVVITIARKNFPLFGYSAAVVTVCYIILSFSHPDYLIARVNIANLPGQESGAFFEGEPYSDYHYLSGLSADAAPVLVPYLKEIGYDMSVAYEDIPDYSWNLRGSQEGFGRFYLRDIKRGGQNSSWREFNVSRYVAQRCIKK